MIQTVLGPIAADELGPVSMHEHVLADASALQRPGIEPTPTETTVQPSTLGYLRWNQLGLADNLRLDDQDAAAADLAAARAHGQHAVVDATSLGLGPNHAALPGVAERSGMTIVAAYGAYLGPPAWYEALDEAERESLFLRALTENIPGVEFAAGMLGIMGTSAEFPASDRASLRAAARAGAATGAAVGIRLDPDARDGLRILEMCRAEGLDPSRILFTNCDEFMDADYLHDLSQAGAVLELCFGNEAWHLGRLRNPSDLQRLDFFVEFLSAHPESRWVLGTSLWTKAQLKSRGGHGYEHLRARVLPALTHLGIPPARIDDMVVTTPIALLDRP